MLLGFMRINEAIDAPHAGGAALLGVPAPSPAWDAGRFDVVARARHWTQVLRAESTRGSDEDVLHRMG